MQVSVKRNKSGSEIYTVKLQYIIKKLQSVRIAQNSKFCLSGSRSVRIQIISAGSRSEHWFEKTVVTLVKKDLFLVKVIKLLQFCLYI